MLLRTTRILLNDAGRGDDRRRPNVPDKHHHSAIPDNGTTEGDTPGCGTGVSPVFLQCSASSKPPVLQRRTLNILALLGVAVVLYGTLLPFHVDPHRELSWRLNWHRPSPGDTIANILLYVPIGVFLRLFFRRRGSSWPQETIPALATAAGLAYLTEVLQTVLPARVPSLTDSVCNTTGSMIGIQMAPLLQRMARNLHGWIHSQLHRQPFAAAAVVVTVGIWVYALAPFDFHPTIRHLSTAWQQWHPASWTATGLKSDARLLLHKSMDAGAYGLLAFLLLLARREQGAPTASAAWHAFTRSVAVVLAIELMQLFTVSHVAAPIDLALGWLACASAVLAGLMLLRIQPDLPHRPMWVFRGLLIAGTAALLALLANAWGPIQARPGFPGIAWLPMAGNFNRTWNGLLGEYTAASLQFALVAVLMVGWSRISRRPAWPPLVLMGPLTLALVRCMLDIYQARPTDTAFIVLAVLVGLAAVRLDRAVFNTRPESPSAWPHSA